MAWLSLIVKFLPWLSKLGAVKGRGAIVLAVVAALGASHGWAFWKGGDVREAAIVADQAKQTAKINARLFELGEQLSRAAAELDAARAAKKIVERRLEDEARNDPGAGRIALPAASVRRLESRWAD